MKLFWVYIVLSTFSYFAVDASLRWRRDGEMFSELQYNQTTTQLSVSLSTENDTSSDTSSNVTHHMGHPTTTHRTTTTRSTTSRSTRAPITRTTRATTKRTTASHTIRHYERTTPKAENVSSFDLPYLNTTEPNVTGENEIKEISTMKFMHTTRTGLPPILRQTTPFLKNGNNSKTIPLNNTTPGDSEYEDVYDETTTVALNKNDSIANGIIPNQINAGFNSTQGPLLELATPTKNLLELIQHLDLTTFLEYIKQAGMEKTLEGPGPFTIFAPSNNAFDALPYFVSNVYLGNNERLNELLEYHIVKGALLSSELSNEQTIPTLLPKKDIRVNVYPVTERRKLITATGAHISFANYRATNGIIHVIEKVLYRIPDVDMVEAISKGSKFKAFSDAIQKTIFKTKLKEGPFTLFAPTKLAFQKLPIEDQDRLLNDKDALENILKYHVLPGTYYLSSLKHGTELPTIEKQMLKFSFLNAFIRVNNATIIEADIPVINGVIHAINAILFPPYPKDSKFSATREQH